MEKTCGNWMLTYYDQHGYEHGYGIKYIPELPAYFQATDDNSQKQLRYYADKGRMELEQRCQQLEQVAKRMLDSFNALRKLDAAAFHKIASSDIEDCCLIFSEQLRELGVSLDG